MGPTICNGGPGEDKGFDIVYAGELGARGKLTRCLMGLTAMSMWVRGFLVVLALALVLGH
ncbi:hypothetical protein GQ607_010266 [Colletotrichum asianum]|uniref:Uncharacterized protein n=1 Tax=Colletotrichum asianum TaxID=702518 RepID=A0A8H3W792_9PEZI|nr:hypothetical protein GQ607_010266 [Colletotrichum asianum]